MSFWTPTSLALLSVPLLPLLLGVRALFRPRDAPPPLSIVWAPLPALLLALVGLEAITGDAGPGPGGLGLGLDARMRPILAMTAAVWLASGLFARATMRDDPKASRYTGFHLLCLGGNVLLLVAADALVFYAGFTTMTLAAWGLVMHRETLRAIRAGRIYLVLALLGEALLLAGLVLRCQEAGGTSLAALSQAPVTHVALALVLLGCGLKAGVVGLHFWLPIAHPAAPAPASAVLSGTMIKAGFVGWVQLLPVGEASLPEWGSIVLVTGLATAFFGVVRGLGKREPKVVLAYSSISQMGLVTVTLGAALLEPAAAAPLLFAALLLVVHHGFAKGALFLGAGLGRSVSHHRRGLLVAGLAVPALVLAGLPGTGGAVAKAALKAEVTSLPEAWHAIFGLALPAASIGTTLLLGRFLALVARDGKAAKRPAGKGTDTGVGTGATMAFAGLVATAVLVSWAWPMARVAAIASLSPSLVWAAVWPVALGAAGAAIFFRRLGATLRPADTARVPGADRLADGLGRLDRLLDGAERRLVGSGWWIGLLLVAAALLLLRPA